MKIFYLLLLACITATAAQAQVKPVGDTTHKPATDTVSQLQILKSGRYNFEKIDSVNTLLSLALDVQLKQDLTLFYADSAVLNQFTTVLEAFGNVHINDNDSMNTYAKYMRYVGKEKMAYLKNNVRLVDNRGGILTTNELVYDLNTKIATYKNGGKVVNKTTVLTSKEGQYYGDAHQVIFKKDVVLNGPDYQIYTDSLLYNTETERADFIAPTTIINGKRKIYTSNGSYDLKTGKAMFTSRSSILDSCYSIVSDHSAFDDKSGLGQFSGNVVYVDTCNHVSLLANQLYVNRNSSSFLATEKPLMILTQEKDSVYITADTLFSGRISDIDTSIKIPVIIDTTGISYKQPDLLGKDSSMNRMFQAWHHVRIFSDSLQAVCDSLFYGGIDSAFRMFGKPIVWANNSQVTADTMYLFTKNKQMDHLYAYYNGFIINKAGSNQYNQIKGKTVNAWFTAGNIHYARAKGVAESVYFPMDDDNKFVGMNRATADAIDMFFENRKPVKVKFINDLKGTTYPMKQIPADEDHLKGFKPQEDLRPKSKEEMFGH